MSEMADKAVLAAENALNNADALRELVAELEGSSRRSRQVAAQSLSLVAKSNISLVEPMAVSFVDALHRPEAQTRWECLDILSLLVRRVPEVCDEAVPEAETALFDEGSGLLRLSAMRFLCRIGAMSPERSERVWPLIDEGIQCYHGDPEFQDMLNSVIEFSSGQLSDAVKRELAARLKFDSVNSKGALQRKARQILDNVK